MRAWPRHRHRPAAGEGRSVSVARMEAQEPPRKLVSGRNAQRRHRPGLCAGNAVATRRSEEHTSELQSLMRISYAVFCLNKKNRNKKTLLLATQHTDTERNSYKL